MKTFLAAAICFFVMIAALFFYVNFMDKETAFLLKKLDELYEDIQRKNWEKAEKDFFDFNKIWDKSKNNFGLFIDHSETDKISESVSSLEAYIKNKDQTESLAKIGTIRLLVMQINDNEKPSLVNIF